MDAELIRSRCRWPLAAYTAMVAAAVALFLLIRRYGETLTAPAPAVIDAIDTARDAATSAAPTVLMHCSLRWPQSSSPGLMNTRGLMELVVLNIGLDLGIISPRLFTMMVLMAVVTTVATPRCWTS